MEDKVLKSLISGILLCGILFQAVFVWFSDAKVFFSLGLWIGVGVAVFMAWHIRYSLEDALDMSEGDAPKHMYRMYGIRMAVVLVVFFITAYFEIGSIAWSDDSESRSIYAAFASENKKEKKVNE